MGFLARAFEHYKGLPHQKEAVAKLEGMVEPHVVEAFAKVFSPEKPKKHILQVPFYSQLDNLRMPYRTCNPSSCAMALSYFRPDAIAGDDDLVSMICEMGAEPGDHAQMTLALRSYGLESVFRYDLSREWIESEIKSDRPVVLGILHQGPRSAPYGGGHMLVAVGTDEAHDSLVCHDPYGSLISGYAGPAREGRFVTYPWAELGPRLLVEGPESGWGRLFFPDK